MDPTDTPTQRLAAAALGQPVTDWIALRRADGRSWREIAADLADALLAGLALTAVRVRVRKPDVDLGLPVEHVAVVVERRVSTGR